MTSTMHPAIEATRFDIYPASSVELPPLSAPPTTTLPEGATVYYDLFTERA